MKNWLKYVLVLVDLIESGLENETLVDSLIKKYDLNHERNTNDNRRESNEA